MKNLKNLSRESLKTIKGGYKSCDTAADCGPGFCCSLDYNNGKGCRTMSGAGGTGSNAYYCNVD